MRSERILANVSQLRKYFPVKKGIIFDRMIGNVRAVDDVSFEIFRGETLGLVGESGSGKTTVGRSLLRIIEPTSGAIEFDGQDILKMTRKEFRRIQHRMQMIFQDPYASLNPRIRVSDIVAEPLEIQGELSKQEIKDRVAELLELVGLEKAYIKRYVHEFSGGQRQRIGIARALVLKPDLIVCDEPISSLDVSIQAQIVNLLEELQDRFGLTYLFIAHDLSMVRQVSDRIAVMYLGKIMELASKQTIYAKPLHPYTKALISAVPVPDPEIEAKRERIVIKGDVPHPSNPPKGCVFNTRCPIAESQCYEELPKYKQVNPGHWVACYKV
ncbi:MAG: ATP-binding cassette domain-containing protein [SAR202 cluster bacterium]|jgi:oligopeptide transport system ATP-binding protein|nr:ATP-binding cassette domain-containing protein [SAR202 cluster bacterium]|tara:strand:- start:852 stop:1832 length:981 start_codon:yes stop_codon:yes gene_type:complete